MTLHIRVLAGRLDRTAGSHVYHRELVRHLAARGHRVSLVCFQAVPEVSACADVYEISPSNGPPASFLWRFNTYFAYRHCTRRLRELRLPPADVVVGGEHLFLRGHQQSWPETPWVYLPHSRLMADEIASYRLPPVMNWATCAVYVGLQRWALIHADRTMRFTRGACRILADHYGPDCHPRFVVNPVGIHASRGPRPERQPGPARLLVVGRLTESKNLSFALETLGRCRDLPWRLDVLGSGDERRRLEGQARRLDLSDRVAFHGHQERLEPWFDQADLLLFPSRLESCGIAMLEAMGHGVPCLAPRPDGVRYRTVADEIIDHRRNGLLADDEADFTRLLREAIERVEDLAPLGRAARRFVLDNHSWDRHLDNYEQLFEELLLERRAARRPAPADRPSAQGVEITTASGA